MNYQINQPPLAKQVASRGLPPKTPIERLVAKDDEIHTGEKKGLAVAGSNFALKMKRVSTHNS